MIPKMFNFNSSNPGSELLEKILMNYEAKKKCILSKRETAMRSRHENKKILNLYDSNNFIENITFRARACTMSS